MQFNVKKMLGCDSTHVYNIVVGKNRLRTGGPVAGSSLEQGGGAGSIQLRPG